jgi:hypothetical protein
VRHRALYLYGVEFLGEADETRQGGLEQFVAEIS